VTRALSLTACLGLAAALAALGPTLATLPPALVAYSALTLLLLVMVQREGQLLDDWRVLLGGALLLRLLFLGVVTDLSVDPYRYLWDGWLVSDGLNPYRFTPSDPILAGRQQDLLFQEMNSQDFHSIYPPFSQWLFLPGGWVYSRWGWEGALLALKGTLVMMEFVGVALLLRALLHFGLRPRYLALYAWNPLVLITIAGVGHSEAGLVFAFGILALGLAADRRALAWTGLGLAVISKGVPIVIAPLLLRHHARRGGWRKSLRAAGWGLLPVALLSIPFLPRANVAGVLDSADLYVRLFEFNAGLHALLKNALAPIVAGDPGDLLGPLLRWTFLGVSAWVGLRRAVHDPRAVLEGALLLMGAYLVLATTVHPWYLLWGLPLLAFVEGWRTPWLWAAWAAFPTYFVYTGAPTTPIAFLFWGGVALLSIHEGFPALRERLLPLAGARKARQMEPFVGGGFVLDLGAGEGYVGKALAERPGTGRKVILADVGNLFQVSLPCLLYDGRRLPLEDGAVDVVVLSLVLHHAEDPDRLLAEALRVARRRVVITESTYRWAWERHVLDRVDRWVNRGRGEGAMGSAIGPLQFDTPEGWTARIEAAGGRVHESRRLNRFGHRHHLFVVEPFKGS
jgi:SAM-dependent methyltransferase